MRALFFLVAVALAYPINGQTCTCESNFEWVKKTFEENDAGFQHVVDQKGHAAYDSHNRQILEKIRAAKTSAECNALLNEWLLFFRSLHIGVAPLSAESPATANNEAGVFETWEVDIPQFEKHISAKQEAGYEGIWDIGGGVYKVGIKKEGAKYVGFIIESTVETWKPKLVKLKIERRDNQTRTTFYLRDHSPVESGKPEFIGENHLKIGQQILRRLSPVFADDPSVEKYFKSINSQVPFLDEMNANTLYLRIPSFDSEQKPAIDKILADNKDKILSRENLIIDLRNNGGGNDDSFAELLPFLYTNPIRSVAVEFLSTELNNEMFRYVSASDDFDEEVREWAKGIYDRLHAGLGGFVNPFGEEVLVYRQDVVHAHPKNVGIIIHEKNGSTTEQFLLAAKQSKKVKLFGVATAGALDISNMEPIESPCEEFLLYYGKSRSLRIPEFAIDDVGLQPDFYLDKTIPHYKWVEFVNEILNQ